MGYYTYFEIAVGMVMRPDFDPNTDEGIDWEIDLDAPLDAIWEEKVNGNRTPLRALSDDSLKWYDWPKDMMRISQKYPDYIFLLQGKGEESGDLWKAVFWRGQARISQAEIVYPDFQPFDPDIQEEEDMDND